MLSSEFYEKEAEEELGTVQTTRLGRQSDTHWRNSA